MHNLKDAGAILDVFQAHGHIEVDEARIYSDGTSEEFLAKLNWKGRGLKVSTKVYPIPVRYRKPRLKLAISSSLCC